MNSSAGKKNRPLALLEEALQILRTGGASVLLLHWTGTLPFAISLLWLLRDTGFNWGGPLLLRDSCICALAFAWMSYWKGLASRSTLAILAPDSQTNAGWITNLLLQTVFQALKLFVMPFAVASILAWPAASVFFRTLSLENGSKSQPIRSGLSRAFAAATSNYSENAVAFLAVVGFAVIAFFNVLITFALMPTLWRILTGYETNWSQMGNPGVVFALFAVSAIATWLLIDPWVQTYAVLRAFYQDSRSDGRDLLRELSHIAATIAICLLCLHAPAKAQQARLAEPTERQALDRGIDRASKDIDYGWLRPQEVSSRSGFLDDLASKVREVFDSAKMKVRQWYRGFARWLRDLLGRQDQNEDDLPKAAPRSQELRWTLGIIAVMISGAIIAFFLRGRKRQRPLPSESASSAASLPDVFDEQLLPSDVSQEEWLRLAFEYLANNETRLAARAFYLANLSYLGTQSFLALALWKSNRIYERELARQPKAGDLYPAFSECNRLYERAWYGMRELGEEQVKIIRGTVDQLRSHA